MGINEIGALKPAPDEYPDGIYEVDLVSDEGGYRIGTAVVTIANGLSSAVISISHDAAKNLGIKLVLENKAVYGDKPVLVAKKAE